MAVSFILVLVLIAVLFFEPNMFGVSASFILILAIGFSITFIVRRNRRAYAQAEITYERMKRSIVAEILALVLVICLAGVASLYTGARTGALAESRWPGEGALVGLAAGILVGVSVGFGVRWGLEKLKVF